MYVAQQHRWVNISLHNLTGNWLRHIEECFAGVNDGGPKASILRSYTSLDPPAAFVDLFFKAYLLISEQLLASEDKSYFMSITQHPDQKPVPFITVLDASFEVWFKKVSLLCFSVLFVRYADMLLMGFLWSAEDIGAVFD